MSTTRRAVLLGLAGTAAVGCTGLPQRSVFLRLRERLPGRPLGRFIGPPPKYQRLSWRDRVGDQDRTGVVVVPSTYDPARRWPVVLVSHGHDQDADLVIERYGWGDTCEERGFIGLFPNTGGEFTSGMNDNVYFLALLDRAGGELAVDPSRVYVAGFSGGCKRAYAFAAAHSDRLAGMAGHSGTIGHREDPPAQWDPRLTAARPLNVVHLHGARDPTVPPRGGTMIPPDGVLRHTIPMRDGLEVWAEVLGATLERGAPPPPELPLRCDFYRWRSADGHLVEGVVDPDLAHTWAPYANTLFVDFFDRTPVRAGETAAESSSG
jgi:poly(3-hydroxybutyrate) depolymerase